MTRVREQARVLPKQATPRYAELRNTAQTVERSHRALALRVGMPSALIRRVISPIREMRSPLFVKARISSLKKSILASVMLSAVIVSDKEE
jgi:hypothetical protein